MNERDRWKDRQTDRQTDIANRRFRNFANAPNDQPLNPHLFQIVILAAVYLLFAMQQKSAPTKHHI